MSLRRLFALVILFTSSAASASSQQTKDPPPRFAVFSTELQLNPKSGILHFGKLERFVDANILPSEKEAAANNLPSSLRGFPLTDQTDEFIADFTKSN